MRGREGRAPSWPSVAVVLAIVVSTLTAGVEAQPVRLIDLLDFGVPAGELTRIRGSSLLASGAAASGARGVPVAGGGDLDGDGFSDAAFASVEAGPLGVAGAGEIIVVFGDGDFGGTLDTVGFAADRLKIAGECAKEGAGVEVEIADVTGDGVADLLIGRQNYTLDCPTTGRPGAGALTILVGGPELRDHAESLAYLELGDIPDEITALTFVGPSSYDRLGIWMRAGDVDGDVGGIADIVVGADEVDATVGMVTLNNGAVYVIRGGAHLAADQIVDLADFGTMDFPGGLAGHVARINPPTDSNNYHFGATCQIGDLDGDGKGEVIVGAGLNRSSAGIRLDGAPGGTGEPLGGWINPENPSDPIGSVFVVWDEHFPATAWTSAYTINLQTATPVTRIDGSVSNPDNDRLGEELLAGLDYDDDGNPDLFIGDLAGNGGNGSFSGVGHVIFNVKELKLTPTVGIDDLIASPPAGVRHTMILGTESGAIGADTALHGDYDGDGLDDLVFCNPSDSPQGRGSAGSLQVLFGEEGGWPAVIDTAPADLPSPEAVRIVEIDGAHGGGEPGQGGGDVLCYSAASGDIDEDGVPDLLVNEMTGQGFADGPDGDLDPEPEDAPDVGNLLLINGASLVERVLLDVDGDGVARPLTDGVLIFRFLSDVTGEALTAGALGTGATRDAGEIEEYLFRAGAALDADADDTLQPLFDGVLALRYLFGFEGAVLVDGALDPQANRTDPAAVESFFDRLQPP